MLVVAIPAGVAVVPQLPREFTVAKFCRKYRAAFTWAVAIFFGAIALLGEGLHLLPGMGHDEVAAQAGSDEGSRSDCAAKSVPGDGFVAGCGTSNHDGDCPICQFYAQAKQVSAAVQGCGLHLVALAPPAAVAARPELPLTLVYLSRAPPSRLA